MVAPCMKYNILTSEEHHEVFLFAFNTLNGESSYMKFPKLGKCVEFCKRKDIPVTVNDVILREDFFALRDWS